MHRRTVCLNVIPFLLWEILASLPPASQGPPDLDRLIVALQNENTSNGAMQELLRRGSDPEVRKYLVRRLPDLLNRYKGRTDGTVDDVWGNEARVAGELKIVEAAPVLARRIDMLTYLRGGGAQVYNFHERAADTALINIGPPAAPFVIEVLKHGNPLQREIAAHVLRYIGTDVAWRALEEDLPGEKDPKVRRRIQEALDSRR